MAEKTQKQQTDERFVQVHKQALVDKQEVLEAIDSRMAKLGTDHDLLIGISANVTSMKGDIAKLSDCLSGPSGNNGIVSDVTTLKSECAQLRNDVDVNARNTNLWGGGNLLTIVGAYIAVWLHK